MQVMLAHQYTDDNGVRHMPDDMIEVDAHVGRDLVRDGFARLPDLDGQTVPSLKAMAEQIGADVTGLHRKDELIAAVEARRAVMAGTAYQAPATGDTE